MATGSGSEHDGVQPEAGRDANAFWGYFGVGCLTFFAGGAGGAMTSVLIAKIVGAIRACPADPETGAPCNWFVFAVLGGVLGAILLPVAVMVRLRSSRLRAGNSERG